MAVNAFEEALVRYFGRERLRKIQAVRVGVAGLGGLGSNCAVALARSGFRKFVLCDFDDVEASNLNRQWYFLDQVGQPKTQALKTNLLRINPDLALTLVAEKITSANAARIFSGCDVVVEGLDRAESKRMLMEAMWPARKFFVSASGLAGWGDADAIVTRRLKETVVLIGDHRSEASADRPPCAPRVCVASAKQADAVLAWVLAR